MIKYISGMPQPLVLLFQPVQLISHYMTDLHYASPHRVLECVVCYFAIGDDARNESKRVLYFTICSTICVFCSLGSFLSLFNFLVK